MNGESEEVESIGSKVDEDSSNGLLSRLYNFIFKVKF
jgi:hypothetical protein